MLALELETRLVYCNIFKVGLTLDMMEFVRVYVVPTMDARIYRDHLTS